MIQLTKPVSVNGHRDQHPSFSPDGTKIVFQRQEHETRGYDLYMINADGSGETLITPNSPASAEQHPSFSPDGKRIVFEVQGLGHSGFELYTMDLTTMDPNDPEPFRKWTRLTFEDPFGRQSRYASFSPDGTKIAFNRSSDIYTINPDGTGEKRLTNTPGSEQFPTFSPDGTKIAFTSNGVETINAEDGSGRARLANSTGGESGVAFSPDGSQVAFMKVTGPEEPTALVTPGGATNLFTMNVANDGSGQARVTNDPLSNEFPDWGIVPGTVPLPTISLGNVTVKEGNAGQSAATFTVSLSRPVSDSVAVAYATADGSATGAGSQADYAPSSGTLTFAPGEKTKTVTVSVNGDRRPEPDENFDLYLSNPSGATLAQSRGTGTIVNDEQTNKR